ncbi:hypothetical protein GCM10010954_31350 [Halobacillus andaensis]|uniref:APS kinase domain-containing protein n=1 Tax=Halobacillus andaensis TaxID=1176239 RepID=A0A917B7I7_HALAA|nr:adenylylsulfate kinase-like enzyme [Halobacillus andaensis]GGF29951.1 hypothetical protein GCM10010954_31350 [Halobacillus andaensis]
MNDAGLLTLTAFISPYQEERDEARRLFEEGEFIEVHAKCSLEEAEKRDPKGLYKKARAGEIKGFTGIDAPYESPADAEIVIETDVLSLELSVTHIISYLKDHQYI